MSFDRYAMTWDTEYRIASHKIRSAMEFGSGTGLISFNLYDSFKEITLIDTSQGMIDILTSKIKSYYLYNMMVRQMDIMSEDSSDLKFDVIYTSMVLHHIPDTDAIIKKFYELLQNDGYLCIVELNEEDGRFHKNEPDFHGHNGFHQESLKKLYG